MTASVATVPGGTVDFSDEELANLGMLFRGAANRTRRFRLR